MTKATNVNSLFTINSSKLAFKLLAHGIANAADYRQALTLFSHRLIASAEQSYAYRDLQAIREASELLVALRLPQATSVAVWYQAICDKREGQVEKAALSLGRLIADQKAPAHYRARAFQTLGAIKRESGESEEAIRLYIEGSKVARNDLFIHLQLGIHLAITQSDLGDHKASLSSFQNLFPLVEVVGRHHPLYLAACHNGLAFELQSLGRLDQAADHIRIPLASPFAYAYPEWIETALKIEQQTAKKNAVAVAVAPEPRKRPAQPKYLLVVLRFSPRPRLVQPKRVRQRVSCKNPTIAHVARVARIRAPSSLS